MKNTAPPRALRGQGFTGAEPPTGWIGKREPTNKVSIGRALGARGKGANLGPPHRGETPWSGSRCGRRQPKNKVSTALPSEARATIGACVMARPRDGRRRPTRPTRAKNANSRPYRIAMINVETILHAQVDGVQAH